MANSNYTITYNAANFNVTPLDVTVSADAKTKAYGSLDPALTFASSPSVGLILPNGDAISFSGSLSRAVGETVVGSPYAINQGSVANSNYSITYNTADLSITPIAATVSAGAKSKVYGSADPAQSGTISGFLVSDGVTASYIRTAGESVAGSPYVISAVLNPAGVLGNYTITYNTALFTIIKKAATVTPDASSKMYGDSDPAFTGTLLGFLGSDNVVATYSRTTGETVLGSPYVISAVLNPAGVLTNYNITYNTAAFTINKANSTVSVTGGTFIYDGAPKQATGFAYGVGGTGDVLSPAVTFSYNPGISAPIEIGTYEVTASFAGNNNYNPSSNTAFITIICSDAAVIQSDFNTAQGGGSSIPTVNKPSGTKSGDLLIVGLMYEKGNATTVSPPTDWKLIRRTNQGNNIGMCTYYKKAGANEPSTYAFVLSSSPKWSIGISRIEGADTGNPDNPNPIDISSGDAGGQGILAVAPSVTTSTCNTLVLTFYTSKKDATWTAPAGTTEVYDYPNIQQGLTSNMMAYYIQSDKGATGSKTAIASLSDYWVAQQIAVRAKNKSGSNGGRNSGTTAINEDQLSQDQQVEGSLIGYPNPVVDKVIIQFPEATQEPSTSSISIFDQIGRAYPINAVWYAETNKMEIDFSAISKGLYLIRVSTDKGTQTVKVFKE